MLVIMLGSGKGLQNGTSEGMGDMATNALFMWTQNTTIPYKGFPRVEGSISGMMTQKH